MALNYVTLTLDLYDGTGTAITGGHAQFAPNVTLTDTTDHRMITPSPVIVPIGNGLATVQLLATDNAAVSPSGWQWTARFTAVGGMPGPDTVQAFYLPYSGGASR